MALHDEDKQMRDIMSQVFPGHEEFAPDSVTPSITGTEDNPVVSFMVVCNQEATKDFRENQEISVEVVGTVIDNKRGVGKDLVLRFDFSFPVFSLQFFTAVEGENARQQSDFARILMEVDYFIIWLVDQDKRYLKVLQVEWDNEKHKEVLETWIS